MLLFYSGNDGYACNCLDVVEVIPRVFLKKIHHLPAFISGLLTYSDDSIPIIDWCQLIEGRQSASSYHTRIIILSHVNKDGKSLKLGIIAEKVIETKMMERFDVIPNSLPLQNVSFLKGLINEEKELIQFVDVEKLFEHFQQLIFMDNKARV